LMASSFPDKFLAVQRFNGGQGGMFPCRNPAGSRLREAWAGVWAGCCCDCISIIEVFKCSSVQVWRREWQVRFGGMGRKVTLERLFELGEKISAIIECHAGAVLVAGAEAEEFGADIRLVEYPCDCGRRDGSAASAA